MILLRYAGIIRSFFFNDTATTEIYTLSLHDALPICAPGARAARRQDRARASGRPDGRGGAERRGRLADGRGWDGRREGRERGEPALYAPRAQVERDRRAGRPGPRAVRARRAHVRGHPAARGRRRDRHRARGPTRGRPRVREAQGVARDLRRRHEGARRAPEDPRRLQGLVGPGGHARADPRADAVDRPLDVVLEERLREPPVPRRAVAVPAAGVAARAALRATHADDLEPRRARGEVRRERVPLSDVVVRVAFV